MMKSVHLSRLAASLVSLQSASELTNILNQIYKVYSSKGERPTSDFASKFKIYTKIACRCLEVLNIKRQDMQLCLLALKVLMQICKEGTSDVRKVVISKGLVKKLVSLLRCENGDEEVIECACNALFDICGWQEASAKDALIACRIGHVLLDMMQDIDCPIETQSCCLLTIQSVIRCGALHLTEIGHSLFACVSRLLMTCDEGILRNSVWVLLEMAKGLTEEQIQYFIRTGICIRLIGLMQHKTTDISSLALQLMSEITQFNAAEAVKCGVLPALKQISRVRFSDAFVMTKVCSIVADAAKEVPEKVVKSKIVPVMLYVARDYEQYGAQAQCCVIKALHHLLTRGSPSTVEYSIQEGCLDYLIEVVQLDFDASPRVHALVLSSIGYVLATGTSQNAKQVVHLLSQTQIHTSLRKAAESKSGEVRHQAISIIFMMQCIGKQRYSSSPKSVVNSYQSPLRHGSDSNLEKFKHKKFARDFCVADVAHNMSLQRSVSTNTNTKLKSLRITN